MTEADLLAYHRALNEQVFDGILPDVPFQLSASKEKDYPRCGEYHGNGWGKGLILIDPAHHDTDTDLVATLAHEMIHQWQDLMGLRLDHCYSFKGWAAVIKERTGLIV